MFSFGWTMIDDPTTGDHSFVRAELQEGSASQFKSATSFQSWKSNAYTRRAGQNGGCTSRGCRQNAPCESDFESRNAHPIAAASH
jgi:hypothetical protein